MAGGFPETVNPPGAASYSAPLLNFAQFGQWANDFQQGQLNSQARTTNDQTQQLNQQKIQQGQRQQEIDTLFAGGLPKDAQGNIDYQKVAAMLAQKGDISALTQLTPLIQQSQAANTPELPGPQGGAPQGGGQQPSSVQARPLPAPAANSPKGDPGQGTLVDVVTDKLPSQNLTTGETITKIAQVMGVDPNATLTPGQLVRAQGLLKKYAPDIAGSGGGGSPLPPSANAGSPAPKITPQPPQAQPAAQPGAPQPQAQPIAAQPRQPQPQPPVAPQPQPAPQQAPQGGPITPQVPLPPGYTDPQEAILALNRRAAQLEAANPKMKPKADDLRAYAARIEKSIQPVPMHSGESLLDPRTGQPLYQGNQPTMSPDAINGAAERYIETGQLPPNMGKGVQGSATMSAIQNHAAELMAQRGIDPQTLPAKWQQFKAQQVGIQRFTSGPQGNTVRSFNVLVDHLDTLGQAASALKNGDIRFLNQWKQRYAAETGETAPTNFDGVKALVGDEIVKAVVGSAGALADREEVKKDLDRASSPKQLSELVDRYRKLALGQLNGLRKQYEVATGQKNFGDMLLPGTLAALGGTEGKSTQDAKSGGVTPDGFNFKVVQ